MIARMNTQLGSDRMNEYPTGERQCEWIPNWGKTGREDEIPNWEIHSQVGPKEGLLRHEMPIRVIILRGFPDQEKELELYHMETRKSLPRTPPGHSNWKSQVYVVNVKSGNELVKNNLSRNLRVNFHWKGNFIAAIW